MFYKVHLRSHKKTPAIAENASHFIGLFHIFTDKS